MIPARPAATLALVAVSVSLIAGCGTQPARSSNASSGEASAAASVHPYVADVDQLVEVLAARHPDPFGAEGHAAFMARVEGLRQRAPGLTAAGFGAELMALLGDRDLDGHTGVFPFIQGSWLEVWPLHLYAFDDGIYVVESREAYDDLVGTRLVEAGGVPIDVAWDRLVPYASRDNEATLLTRVTELLVLPQVLAAAGLDPEAGLLLEGADGERHPVVPEPVPASAHFSWLTSIYPHFPICLPPDADGPPWLRNRERAFWVQRLRGRDAVYVGYNQVVSGEGQDSLFSLIGDIQAAAPNPETLIVVDVRNNGGGDNTTFGPLRAFLWERAEAAPGSVIVVTGRCTFSAAANFVTRMEELPGVRLVGEPMGGGLNNFGDTVTVTLAHSGVVALIATSDVQYAPGDDRLTIEPDRTVPMTWADYAAGRDPVMETALR